MKKELEQRIAAIQLQIVKAGLHGLIIQDQVNSLYLSGFPCSNSVILITRRDAFFFTDFRYIVKARSSINHLQVEQMPQNALEEVASLAKKQRLRRIGFEECISYSQYTTLQKAMSADVELIPSGRIVQNQRMVKSPGELRIITANQRLNQKIYNSALEAVTASSRETDIRNHIRLMMIENNCEEAFETIIARGENSASPHAVAGQAKVKAGQLLLFDMGVKKHHYHSDMTRTVAVGEKLSTQAKEIYEIVRHAQAAALKKVKPGAACKDIDHAARDLIAKAGYGDYFGHGLGHGVGLEIHEGPTLNPKSSQILEPGMVITVEPGIYLPNVGGVRIEDLLVVTDTGFRNLTSIPKTLRYIGV